MDQRELTLQTLAQDLRESLERQYGPLLGGKDLCRCLGLASSAALRQARRRGRVAVTLFTLPKRRGHFALTREVAVHLAQARLTARETSQREKGVEPHSI